MKKEKPKLLKAVTYLIYDSSWVSMIHVIPKKVGMTVIRNEKNELILIHTVMGWYIGG